MKHLVLIALMLIAPLMSSAQVIEEVHTKDGSIYFGFISEQIPGRQMAVYTENAYIVFDKADVVDVREDYYDFNLLSETSKGLIRDLCDTTSLYLTSFKYKGSYFENLYVADSTETTICAHSLCPRTYFVPWAEVLKVSKALREEEPYGLREVVTLTSGERFEGQIMEQNTASGMTIRDMDGGLHISGDVQSILIEKISNKHDIWVQAPLLDRVITSDGSVLEGLITSRILGKSVSVLLKSTSEVHKVNVEDIERYQKTRNSVFEKYVLDTTQTVCLNDVKVKLVTLMYEDGYYMNSDAEFNTIVGGMEISLMLKNVPHGKTIAIYEYKVKKSGRDLTYIIPEDALPIYETTLSWNDDKECEECTLLVRKSAKYYIAVDGMEKGVNVIFEK